MRTRYRTRHFLVGVALALTVGSCGRVTGKVDTTAASSTFKITIPLVELYRVRHGVDPVV